MSDLDWTEDDYNLKTCVACGCALDDDDYYSDPYCDFCFGLLLESGEEDKDEGDFYADNYGW